MMQTNIPDFTERKIFEEILHAAGIESPEIADEDQQGDDERRSLRSSVFPRSVKQKPLPAKESYFLDDFLTYHDHDFVVNAYYGVLKRPADSKGLGDYLGKLRRARLSKVEVLGRLRFSPEGRKHKTRIIGLLRPLIYQSLCRLPIVGYLLRMGICIIKLPSILRDIEESQAFTSARFYEVKQLQDEISRLSEHSLNGIAEELTHKVDNVALGSLREEISSKTDTETVKRLSAQIGKNVDLLLSLQNEISLKADADSLSALNEQVKLRAELLSSLQQELSLKADIDSLKDLKREIILKGEQLASLQQGLSLKADLEEMKGLNELIGLKADLETMENLQKGLLLKADLSLVKELWREVAKKADAAKVDDFQGRLEGKVDFAALELIQNDLSGKADRESLDALQDSLDDKADLAFAHQLQDSVSLLNEDVSRGLKDLSACQLSASDEIAKLAARFPEYDQLAFAKMYVAFEDKFRGPREMIKERMRYYLPFVGQAIKQCNNAPVLDIGCGRGEFLEILKEAGASGVGVDLNEEQVRLCQKAGLEAYCSDALEYLKNQESNSLAGVVAFHIIEHLPLEVVLNVFGQMLRVLKTGGLAIIETPNPQNVLVGSCNFYLDPTHRNPMPSQLTQFLMENAGFDDVQIHKLNPSTNAHIESGTDLARRFNDYFYGAMDYGIIAKKENQA